MINNPPTDQCKIMFFNCQGANENKFNILSNQLSDFHIIILSETWNCQEQIRRTLPFYFSSTLERPQTATHNSGGIMILSRPGLIPSIHLIYHDQHSILFSFNSLRIATAYLPPSLSDQTVSHILQKTITHNCNVFVGDINCRFGKLLGDDRQTNPSRSKLFHHFCTSAEMTLHRPATGKAGVDHLFSKPFIHCFYHYREHPSVISDHKFMDITFHASTNVCPTFSIPKYRLSLINSNPHLEVELCSYYDSLAPVSFPASIHHSEFVNNDGLQQFVDNINDIIHHCVSMSAELSVGKYPPGPPIASRRPSSFPSHQHHPNEYLKSMKLAAKSVSRPIASRFPEISPMEDSVNFFTAHFQPHPDSPQPPDLPPITHLPPPSFLNVFTASNVTAFIKKYPSRKSGGCDGIHIRLLKRLLKSSFPQHLTQLFHLCLTTGCTPCSWNVTLINPIPKREDANTINTCRPISLTIMFRRIFEGLLLRCITNSTSLNDCHPLQAGFRLNSDTLYHPIVAHEAAIRQDSIHVFYDFASAYDRVDLSILFRKILQRHPPPFLIHLLYSLFQKTLSRISINNQISEPFRRFRGLLQGSLLSPLLFNLYIDDLAESIIPRHVYVANHYPFPPIQLFADDIKITANTDSEVAAIHHQILSWTTENFMALNADKCGVVTNRSDIRLLIDGHPIPNVPEYKYLGLPMTTLGIDSNSLIQRHTNKAHSTLQLLKAIGYDWPLLIKLTTFKAFCRSTLDFALIPLWGISQNLTPSNRCKLWHQLEKIQYNFISWIFPSRFPAKSRNINLSLLGLPTLEFRASILAFQFLRRLTTQHPFSPIQTLSSHIHRFPIQFDRHISLKNPILTKLKNHPFLSSIDLAASQPLVDHFLTTQYRQHLQNPLHAATATLPRLIDPNCRSRGILYDSGLRHPHLANFIANWRRNVWHFGDGVRRRCPNSDTASRHSDDPWFRRTCPDDCHILQEIDWGELGGIYHSTKDLFTSSTDLPENTTLIDFIINRRQYKLLRHIVFHLERLVPLRQFQFTTIDHR